MEDIDHLGQDIKRLSLAARLGISFLIAGCLVQCFITLTRAPYFAEIFNDLAPGVKLPCMTDFFIRFSSAVIFGVVILSLLGIAGLFAFSKKIWSIPGAIVIAIVITTIAQLASISFYKPLIHLFSNLMAS